MKVLLVDADCILETQDVGDTKHGVVVPRVGDYVYGEDRMCGHVSQVAFHYFNDCVTVRIKRG